jgi:hypothetical protein
MQYAAGTSDPLLDAISNQIHDVDVLYRDDSAVIFKSEYSAKEVAALPFAKNAFIVLTAPLEEVSTEESNNLAAP